MNETLYKKQQAERQLKLLTGGFFGCAQGRNKDIPILPDELCKENLFNLVRYPSLSYFRKHAITWWGEEKYGCAPTGHLLSSQVHCLNHLFLMRDDESAILEMLNAAQDIVHFVKVISNPIDGLDNSLIAFEFVYNNEILLKETRQKRGAKCTSVDAVIYLQDENGQYWLVPIEWKYTEMYDKEKSAVESSLQRYRDLVGESSNLQAWFEDKFKFDPCYELARQTLLIERIIISEDTFFPVDNYLHILVVPKENSELYSLVQKTYVPTLKDQSKFIIVDPKEFVLPGLASSSKYNSLTKYLSIRYW